MTDVQRYSARTIVFGALLALLFLFLLSKANAQTYTATATWDAVSTTVNGNPLIGPVTYNLWRGIKVDGTDLQIINLAPITTTTFVDTTITVSGVYYYSVTALNGGQESAKSALVRFSKGDVLPKVPNNLSIH